MSKQDDQHWLDELDEVDFGDEDAELEEHPTPAHVREKTGFTWEEIEEIEEA